MKPKRIDVAIWHPQGHTVTLETVDAFVLPAGFTVEALPEAAPEIVSAAFAKAVQDALMAAIEAGETAAQFRHRFDAVMKQAGIRFG